MLAENRQQGSRTCQHSCPPCNENIDYSCFFRNSISHLTSFVVFGIAIYELIKLSFLTNNRLIMLYEKDPPLLYFYYGFICLFSIHWFRVYLRMLIFDDDEEYCLRILSKFSKTQLKIEWISRLSIISSLFLLELHLFEMSLAKYVMIIYICLFIWDLLIFSFYLNKQEKISNADKKKDWRVWLNYFTCDLLGIFILLFLIAFENNSTGTLGSTGVLLGLCIAVFSILLVYDFLVNKTMYFKQLRHLRPNFKCSLSESANHRKRDEEETRTFYL